MKIDGWSIEAFGPIQDWIVEGLVDHGTVIVLGDNETGKSALFEFLATALFGFAPATADAHPYRPWDGRFPAGALHARLRDGRAVRIARRLTSRPEGAVEIEGRSEEVANRPVDWVGNLGRPVFTNIHALTQDEALQLDARAWQQVEDRVLGGASYDFLRPAREVVDALESQRLQLWRPDRRGKPRARVVRERVRALRQELAPALERRGRIETLDDRLAEIESEIDALRTGPDGLHPIEVTLDRDVQLTPILRRVQRMEELASKAETLVPDDNFSDAPRGERDAARHAMVNLDDEIATLCKQVDDAVAAQDLNDLVCSLLAGRADIERLHSDRSLHVEDLDRVRRMDRELEHIAGQLDDMAGRVLERPLDTAEQHALLAVSDAELRGRFEAWADAGRVLDARTEDLRRAERARVRLESDLPEDGVAPDLESVDARLRDLRELEREEALREHGKVAGAGAPRWAVALVAVAGLGLVVAGFVIGAAVGSVLVALGALVAGGTGLALAWDLSRSAADGGGLAALRAQAGIRPGDDVAQTIQSVQIERDEAAGQRDVERRLEEARRDEDDAREQVSGGATRMGEACDAFFALLQTVPVAPVHRERPVSGLLRDLESGRQLLRRRADTEEDRAEVVSRVDAWRAEVLALRDESVGALPDDPLQAITAIRAALTEAVRAGEVAETATAALPELRGQLEQTQADRVAAEAELERLHAQLRTLDPVGADPAAGLVRLEESRAALAEHDRVRSDLDRESPGWADRLREADRLRAEGTVIELTSEQRVELRARANNMRARIEALADERGRLTTERNGLMQAPGPAYVQGAIEEAEVERAETHRAHNRLALLAAAVREAERRYREAHQSPLLATASAYLAHITGGRYDLLTVDETGGKGVRLRVRRSGEGFPIKVDHPLSRGTLQQVYLALRLAMVDQVEAEEPLPVFLDEMFVNWDPHRTEAGVEVLRDLAPDRQVFMFTADPHWAERARSHIDARVVETPTISG